MAELTVDEVEAAWAQWTRYTHLSSPELTETMTTSEMFRVYCWARFGRLDITGKNQKYNAREDKWT